MYDNVCLKYDNVCPVSVATCSRPRSAGLGWHGLVPEHAATTKRSDNSRMPPLYDSNNVYDNVCLHHDNVYLQYDNIRPIYDNVCLLYDNVCLGPSTRQCGSTHERATVSDCLWPSTPSLQ